MNTQIYNQTKTTSINHQKRTQKGSLNNSAKRSHQMSIHGEVRNNDADDGDDDGDVDDAYDVEVNDGDDVDDEDHDDGDVMTMITSG